MRRGDRRKVEDVVWLAFQYAKQDRQSLIDAYCGDESQQAVKDARADIRAFERLQMRFFGTTKSRMEAILDNMIPVPITELFKKLREREMEDLD